MHDLKPTGSGFYYRLLRGISHQTSQDIFWSYIFNVVLLTWPDLCTVYESDIMNMYPKSSPTWCIHYNTAVVWDTKSRPSCILTKDVPIWNFLAYWYNLPLLNLRGCSLGVAWSGNYIADGSNLKDWTDYKIDAWMLPNIHGLLLEWQKKTNKQKTATK